MIAIFVLLTETDVEPQCSQLNEQRDVNLNMASIYQTADDWTRTASAHSWRYSLMRPTIHRRRKDSAPSLIGENHRTLFMRSRRSEPNADELCRVLEPLTERRLICAKIHLN